jgi:hypothetical protein
VAGEATVYVQLGAFHKPVNCYVMDMLYEVDLILGEEFLDKYDCILHYGKGCKTGRTHMVPVISEAGKASGRNDKRDFALVFPYLFENAGIFLFLEVGRNRQAAVSGDSRRGHFLTS